MIGRYVLASASLAVIATLSVASPVFAQTVLDDQRQTPSWAESDIVVTGQRETYATSDTSAATKTNTPLINVPQSVQVLNKTLIEEQDRRTLGEALVNVSGVTPVRSEEVIFTQPIIRGFGSDIFIDGLPAFSFNSTVDPTSLAFVERIEVVKGPSSTIYGGGVGAPLGGLINIVSKRPEDQPGGFVALRGGSYGTINPYFDLNVPLTDGIAARIGAEYQHNDHWVDRVEGDRWSIQPSVRFQISPSTELLVRGQYDRRSQLEYSGIPAGAALAGTIDRNAFPGTPSGQPRTVLENRLATGELTHRFSDNVRLTITGRYYDGRAREYGSFILGDADPGTQSTYTTFKLYLPGQTKEATGDANLVATVDALGGQHVLLGGINYDRTKFTSSVSNADPAGSVDLANPDYSLPFGAIPEIFFSQNNRYETWAGYVQDQATYGALHLSGSLRYTNLKLRQAGQAVDRTYSRLNPRVGASFDLTPGVAVFAGYATGFRGPLNFIGLTPPKPETSRNLEAGLKLALTRIGLSGTIAAFELTRRNVSAADPDNFGFSIQTGEQRSRGVEADMTWEPTPSLSVLATYAYTHAEVSEDTVIPVGDRLTRVPRHSGRVAARYRLLAGPAKGLAFGAGVTAFTSREITLPNTIAVPGYAVVDAQVAYDIGRFTLQASFVNLGDRKGFDPYQYLGIPVAIPLQPRSAYLALKVGI